VVTKEQASAEQLVCPYCGKTAEPYCDLPECGLAGEEPKNLSDLLQQIKDAEDLWKSR
jgi:hypothetical protein